MATVNPVPEKLINFRVYNDGVDYLGAAEVTLPKLESLTSTVRGAGIAGEVESPTLGHYKPMAVSINWRTVDPKAMVLLEPKAHSLDIRGAQQVYDSGVGGYVVIPIRCFVVGTPKNGDIGKFSPGDTTDSSTELEVSVLKLSINEKEVVSIDKYNYVCVINGTDYMSAIRSALGM